MASRSEVEQVIFIIGATDIVPAIKLIKKDFPPVHVGGIFPFRRATHELICEVDFLQRTRQNILHRFQIPNHIKNADGKIITKPTTW